MNITSSSKNVNTLSETPPIIDIENVNKTQSLVTRLIIYQQNCLETRLSPEEVKVLNRIYSLLIFNRTNRHNISRRIIQYGLPVREGGKKFDGTGLSEMQIRSIERRLIEKKFLNPREAFRINGSTVYYISINMAVMYGWEKVLPQDTQEEIFLNTLEELATQYGYIEPFWMKIPSSSPLLSWLSDRIKKVIPGRSKTADKLLWHIINRTIKFGKVKECIQQKDLLNGIKNKEGGWIAEPVSNAKNAICRALTYLENKKVIRVYRYGKSNAIEFLIKNFADGNTGDLIKTAINGLCNDEPSREKIEKNKL